MSFATSFITVNFKGKHVWVEAATKAAHGGSPVLDSVYVLNDLELIQEQRLFVQPQLEVVVLVKRKLGRYTLVW